MKRLRLILALALLLLIGLLVSRLDQDAAIFFPQQSLLGGFNGATAQLEGDLSIANSCIWVTDPSDGTNYLVIWPATYTVKRRNNLSQIHSLTGTVLAKPGDVVRVAGAATTSLEGFNQISARLIEQLASGDCAAGNYWIASRLERIDRE